MKINKKISLSVLILILFSSSLYSRSVVKIGNVKKLPVMMYIKNAGTGMYLEAEGGYLTLHSEKKNSRNQKWVPYPARKEGEFMLKNYGNSALIYRTRNRGKSYVVAIPKKRSFLNFIKISDTRFLIRTANNEVLDAEGGIRNKREGQKVIAYRMHGNTNQQWEMYYLKRGKIVQYKASDFVPKNPLIENRKTSDGKTNGLVLSLEKTTTLPQYMSMASYSQFKKENKGNVLSYFINSQNLKERYRLVKLVVNSVRRNEESKFRRFVYAEISNIKVSRNSPAIQKDRAELKKLLTEARKTESDSNTKYLMKLLINQF